METLEQRYARQFDRIDLDKSGFLDLGDLARQEEEVVRLAGVAADSPEAEHVAVQMRGGFISLIRLADSNKDAKVSKAEFVAALSQAARDKRFPSVVQERVKFAFDLVDSNHNGAIGSDELASFLARAHSVTDPAKIKVIHEDVKKVAPNGRVMLAEVEKVVADYYLDENGDTELGRALADLAM
ncbi:EF-hand domain-containing protein [Streptomyces sp. NPDC005385]|uniref:EF-hand domain-containing protein n=1 Tax=Streptomyces sp. NPDC005385 TaxID=3157039 RepID=UPI0033A6F2E8